MQAGSVDFQGEIRARTLLLPWSKATVIQTFCRHFLDGRAAFAITCSRLTDHDVNWTGNDSLFFSFCERPVVMTQINCALPAV